ncbi:hypothetical protein R0J89_22745, partial [Psychrobacter sp. SIMBA_152]
GFETNNRLTFTAISDIVKLKTETVDSKQARVSLNFLQFYLTINPLKHLAMTGQHNDALRWINYALCDDLSDNQVKSL